MGVWLGCKHYGHKYLFFCWDKGFRKVEVGGVSLQLNRNHFSSTVRILSEEIAVKVKPCKVLIIKSNHLLPTTAFSSVYWFLPDIFQLLYPDFLLTSQCLFLNVLPSLHYLQFFIVDWWHVLMIRLILEIHIKKQIFWTTRSPFCYRFLFVENIL